MKKIFTLAFMALFAAVNVSAELIKTEIIKTDFSDGNGIGGWGGKASFSTEEGVCTLTNSAKGNNWDSQACVQVTEAIPVEAVVTLNIKAKASEPYTLTCAIQNPDGYKGCGNFEPMNLTEEYQEFTRTATCTGENALRILLNFGDIEGSVDIDEIEIYYEVEGEVDTRNHVLEITTTKKDNPWDSQLRIAFGDILEAGKKYTMTMQVISDEDMTISTEFIQEPAPNNCKDQWGGSWFFEYAANMESKTEWSTVQSWINGTVSNNNEDCNGHDEPMKHTGEPYKPTYAYLTFGKYEGTFQIDNVTVTDEEGNIVYQNDFEENLSGISTPSWHGHIKMSRPVNEEVPEFNIPTAISNVAVDSAKAQKALKNGQIVITRGAKAYNAVGQEL